MRRISRILVGGFAAALAAAAAFGGAAAAGGADAPPSLAAAIAIQERHTDRLLEIPGVVGTGVGRASDGRAVIRVYLARSGVQGLPAQLEGVPVSRLVTGMFVARGNTTARYRPAPIGVSTGHPLVTAGTIGARVKNAAGNLFALSNNHVYAAENDAVIGDNVLQPGTYDGGTNPADAIGTLYDFQPLKFDGSNNTMDAAIALSDGANLGNSTLADGYGTPSSTTVAASVGQQVKKYGRTTQQTAGQVSEVNVTVNVCYEVLIIFCVKSAKFVNQIAVTPGSFSAGGDSGSLIVTQSGNNPVGLLFAGSSTRTLANPIGVVLSRFNVTIDGAAGGGNQPPSVSAGPDQTITLPGSAALDGTVTDDGQPSGTLTTQWTKDSGPGTVTFGDASAVDTTATFSAAGTYVLRLTADDGAAQSFDTIQITVNPEPGAGGSPLYFSLGSSGTVGGVSAANEDVVFYDGTSFSLYFDGSDVGVSSLRIDAFARLDASTLLLSFDAAGTVTGIAGTVDDSDVVRFDATSLGSATTGTFSLYFDGSDVGLTTSDHDVDAVEPLADGRILVSTTGSVSVSGASGRDEDLLAFTPTSLGDATAGSFALHFDGSDVGLGDSGEDVDGVAVDASGKIHLSTTNVFAAPGVSGQDEDVFVFTPSALGSTTSGSYSPALYFDGSSFGLDANDLFAIDLP